MTRALLQQALEAWDCQRNDQSNMGYIFEDIRIYLAQPEPSPVAWVRTHPGMGEVTKWPAEAEIWRNKGRTVINLYAAPPAPDSFEKKLLSNQIANLTKELADMTAERDWISMVFDDALEARSNDDRLDAQRWQTLMSSTLLEPHSTEILAAIDKAIATGGQP